MKETSNKTVFAKDLKIGDKIVVLNHNEHNVLTVTNAHGGTPSIRRIFTTNQDGKKEVHNFGMMVNVDIV